MKLGKATVVTLKKGQTEIRLDHAELRRVLLALRALEHETRQQIAALLDHGNWLNVTDIFVKLRAEQSIISQHLAFLRQSQLVLARRQGKFVFYTLHHAQRQKLSTLVESLSPTAAAVADRPEGTLHPRQLEQTHALMRALAHPLRLRMLEYLDKNRSVNVNKIYKALKLEQSITSQHLRILRAAGLVECRREGKFIFYSVAYQRLQEVIAATGQYNRP
jgi:DNA-binding transcriptional ArsR family regulator